ncbi:DUSAM domain-containing protein [Stigmatella sp. ncwal1]|uniref:DUSAM domain-containing protein n=1 Tax=Stigmatella ashevillensis TaxID=2995309 RepID=A0ABT5DLV1_9BACT|nr:DUSAM domain-containing protein [Stigmatella ashevillena]
MNAELDALWEQLWGLENRVNQGEPLELTERVRDLLRRAAPTVAISNTEVEAALADVESATVLLRKVRARIHNGSNRIVDALYRMSRLRKKGDIEGARQQMRDVLAVEDVPHYREIAEGQLAGLDELP